MVAVAVAVLVAGFKRAAMTGALSLSRGAERERERKGVRERRMNNNCQAYVRSQSIVFFIVTVISSSLPSSGSLLGLTHPFSDIFVGERYTRKNVTVLNTLP